MWWVLLFLVLVAVGEFTLKVVLPLLFYAFVGGAVILICWAAYRMEYSRNKREMEQIRRDLEIRRSA